MKLQLKTLGIGLLLILGVNAVFAIPFGAIAAVSISDLAIVGWIDDTATVICAFGRVVGMVLVGMLLCSWRNHWERFSPSQYCTSYADFFQRYAVPLVILVVCECVAWQGWHDSMFLLVNTLTSGLPPIRYTEDGSPLQSPLVLVYQKLFLSADDGICVDRFCCWIFRAQEQASPQGSNEIFSKCGDVAIKKNRYETDSRKGCPYERECYQSSL